MLLIYTKIRSLLQSKKGLVIVIVIGLTSLHLCGPQSVFSTDEQPPDVPIPSAGDLSLKKLETEIQKLQVEIIALQINNGNVEVFMKRITAPLGAISGLAASLIALLIFFLGRKVSDKISLAQEAKLEQEKEFGREKHNLELFQTLADNNQRIQLAAAAVLVQRLDEFRSKEEKGIMDVAEIRERATIISVLLSSTKESRSSDELLKFIGDNLVMSINARLPEDIEPSEDIPSPLLKNNIDWQKSRFVNVWWKQLDARKVDFFGAKIEYSGLAKAFLRGAVFIDGSLEGTVLRDAKLQGAYLQKTNVKGADFSGADLTGARFEEAIYDDKTKWPDGFDPDEVSAIKQT